MSGAAISIVPSTPSAEDAVITLSCEGMKKSATIRILPPGPPKALAVILLDSKITKVGSMVIFPPAPAPPATDVVISLFCKNKIVGFDGSPDGMVIVISPPSAFAASVVILPPLIKLTSFCAVIAISPATPAPAVVDALSVAISAPSTTTVFAEISIDPPAPALRDAEHHVELSVEDTVEFEFIVPR